MVQQIRVRGPRAVLRTAANLPGTANLPGARAMSDQLNALVDSLPGLNALPSPVSLAGNGAGPPAFRAVLINFEQGLPTGIPRLSQFVPDIRFDGLGNGAGNLATSDVTGAYRDFTAQSSRQIAPGGYRTFAG